MNIHPVFVHFPIAFFTIYSLAEFLRFKKLTTWTEFFYVKAVLVLVGFGGACLAIITGLMAKLTFPPGSQPPQLNTHEGFAITTTVIFGFLAGAYAVAWLERAGLTARLQASGLGRFILALKHWLIESPLTPLLALAGLVCVFVTGALGGSMVYGPNGDPFIGFVYHLLIK